MNRTSPLDAAVIGGLLLAIVAGFTVPRVVKSKTPPPLSASGPDSVRLWVDQGTGCEYLVTPTAITPRLFSDGVPVCPGEVDDADLPPWMGGSDESPVLDDPDDQDDQALIPGANLPGWDWDEDSRSWFKEAADDVEDTAVLESSVRKFTF
jgi:hypothetical protein